jgi:glycosyltransferase A (GT-A) superfamily protein (DUF2064 family)
MDTPQLTPARLEVALRGLEASDSVLGPAFDGGYWAIGLKRPDPRALLDVPMSSEMTLTEQRRRLRSLGLSVADLETLRDVDTFADAVAVAAEAPATRFARALARLPSARLAA